LNGEVKTSPFFFTLLKKHSTKRLTIISLRHIFNYMVEHQTAPLDSIFHALGDATRRRMLRQLAGGERTVSELAEPFEMSLAAASKHIKVLESAGLIRRQVQGRTHMCRLESAPLASASDWLSYYEQFWTSRLDTLDQLLRAEDSAKSSTPRKGKKP
jgi:DNA-binding transcriptional ArsR family regulator